MHETAVTPIVYCMFLRKCTENLPQAQKTQQSASNISAVMFKKGEKPVYLDISSKTSLDESMNIMKNNDYLLMTELGSHNFRRLGTLGKYLVIAAVDPSKETETNTFLKDLKEVARNLEKDMNHSILIRI